jgi:tRNA(fMet)-specific endonuclease VapC
MTTSGVSGSPARLALDTSAYSRFRFGDWRVHDLIAAAELVLVPVTVLGELHGAFEFGGRARENRASLADFLAEPFVKIAPATADVARGYGKIYAALRRAGRPIPVNDMWIAATAMNEGACLVTFDRDYEHVAGLDFMLFEGIEAGSRDEDEG